MSSPTSPRTPEILTIRSSARIYPVEGYPALEDALRSADISGGALCLVDQMVFGLYATAFESADVPPARCYPIKATEDAKSFETLTPIFVWLMEQNLKRDGRLVVIGGGVLQDIGCFIASVLFRGVRWDLLPTTLLAQCDSCVGSKSSINIRSYKNQIGTFFAPHRVLLSYAVLDTLPWDEIRSGAGEIIKLHLLTGESAYREVMALLPNEPGRVDGLPAAIESSLRIKKTYIEQDEFDTGIRNLLNYGHTFGHAYESATHYGIPHGIGVTLGMLTATYVSARLGLVSMPYFARLWGELRPWYAPYQTLLASDALLNDVLRAIKLDKKATAAGVNCILTHGAGQMEKRPVPIETLSDLITDFSFRVPRCRIARPPP